MTYRITLNVTVIPETDDPQEFRDILDDPVYYASLDGEIVDAEVVSVEGDDGYPDPFLDQDLF